MAATEYVKKNSKSNFKSVKNKTVKTTGIYYFQAAVAQLISN